MKPEDPRNYFQPGPGAWCEEGPPSSDRGLQRGDQDYAEPCYRLPTIAGPTHSKPWVNLSKQSQTTAGASPGDCRVAAVIGPNLQGLARNHDAAWGHQWRQIMGTNRYAAPSFPPVLYLEMASESRSRGCDQEAESAQQALARGDSPVGIVVVRGGAPLRMGE